MNYNNRSIRIVMVDDDKDDIFLTKMAFKRGDVDSEFIGLPSGKALFDHIKNKGIGSIDLLLLDLNMPIQNGHEVLKKLNDYPHFSDLCTIMFSTSRRSIDKDLSRNYGAAAFVVKPGSVSETGDFVKKVVKILNSREYAVAC